MTDSGKHLKLTREDVMVFCSAIAQAPRQMREARQAVTDQYDLGPRGAWILGLISVGFDSPSALAAPLMIGRSLITAELKRLTEADLIVYRKHDGDGRRWELALTPLGETANRQLTRDIRKMLQMRLSSYTRDQILLCVSILRDFSRNAPQFFEGKASGQTDC